MVEVICQEDCGNAPKRIQLRDAHIAYAEGKHARFLDNLTDTVRWEIVGESVLEGKAAVAEAMQHTLREPIVRLVLLNIITHGTSASVNGTVTRADGSSYAFCDVYQFNSHGRAARIKTITTYRIAT